MHWHVHGNNRIMQPKIVALLLAGEALTPNAGLALVAVVMAAGGILNARKVAETLSRKIVRMSPGQGFTAPEIQTRRMARRRH